VSTRSRELSDDEAQLWLRVTTRVKARKQREAPAKSATVADEPDKPKHTVARRPAPAPSRAEAKAPPADRGGEKRVRRGRIEIDASLDLHGHTQETGRAALTRFLIAAHRRGARAVIVVTGVGRTGQGVLRQRLPEWLADAPLRAIVSGLAQAHRQHGGAGAFYVFLKKAAE
jgi:DNA-nicking Smr family endonuclease